MMAISQKAWLIVVVLLGCQNPIWGQTTFGDPWQGYPPPGTTQRVAPNSSFDAMSTIAGTQANLAKSMRPVGFVPPTSHASCLDTHYFQTDSQTFEDFISPITNPIYFEDPRNLTEIRTIFMQQKIPLPAGCGDFQVYAGQIRASLSENLSLVVNKAGYVTSSNSLVNDGWLDFSAGLKLNLVQDARLGQLLSTGFSFETPTGETSARQGNGDGELHLYLSGAKRLGACAHWMSGFGARVPMNLTDESQSMYWSNHWDYRVNQRFYILTELNWYHWLKSGQDGCFCYEGLDLFNLGTSGVAGNDIVTAAVGAKIRSCRNSELGIAFEVPLTERRDILENRITVDWIVRL